MEIIKIVQDGIELDVNGGEINASSITQDADNRLVTDAEKTTWNNKQDKLTAGTNVSITGTTISAKDTIYDDTALKTRITAVENREDKDTTYTAGANITIDSGNKISADVDLTGYAKLTGATFTGKISSPIVSATRYFETPTLVGEGDDSKYFHRVVFGHKNFDKMEFHEYGGLFSFLENKKGGANDGRLLFQINTSDVDSKVPLKENGVRVYSPNNKPTAADLGITKSDVGLGNVDNIKQMPISGGILENYSEKLVTVSASGGSINLSLGNVFQHTPSGNITYSITNAVNGQAHSFTLIINMGSTVRTLTFPASVKWQGGEVPDMSTANKTYVLTFMSVNGGTTWLGMFGGEF